MAEIIGVKFKQGGKLYYFRPNDEYLLQGSQVIVETARGLECGEVVMERRTVPDEQITHELKQVIRGATPDDLRRVEQNREKEKTAFTICQEKIAAHKLEMNLVSVEYAFDGSKILFCFTSDGRVDFRELVKDLASVFHTRIELRQIGVRDEAKMFGGLGICGRPFCCNTFMGDFIPVSIKMAKDQGLSLNPVKISGTCGRLMCCLKYEEDAYSDLIKHTPAVGMHVSTPDGNGTIIESNLISGNLRIVLDDKPDAAPHTYNKKVVSPLGDKSELSEHEAALFSSYEEVPEEPVDEQALRMLEDEPTAEAAPTRRNTQERSSPDKNRQHQPRPQRGSQPNNQNNQRGEQSNQNGAPNRSRQNNNNNNNNNNQSQSRRSQGSGQNRQGQTGQSHAQPNQNRSQSNQGHAPSSQNRSRPANSQQQGQRSQQSRPNNQGSRQDGGANRSRSGNQHGASQNRQGHPQNNHNSAQGKNRPNNSNNSNNQGQKSQQARTHSSSENSGE